METALVLGLIGLAVAFLVRRIVRTLRPRSSSRQAGGRGGGCGCGPTKPSCGSKA